MKLIQSQCETRLCSLTGTIDRGVVADMHARYSTWFALDDESSVRKVVCSVHHTTNNYHLPWSVIVAATCLSLSLLSLLACVVMGGLNLG